MTVKSEPIKVVTVSTTFIFFVQGLLTCRVDWRVQELTPVASGANSSQILPSSGSDIQQPPNLNVTQGPAGSSNSMPQPSTLNSNNLGERLIFWEFINGRWPGNTYIKCRATTQRIPHCLKNMKGMMQVVRILAYLDLGGRGSSPHVQRKYQKRQKRNTVNQQAQGSRPEKSCNSWHIQLSKANSGCLFAESFCKSF